MLGELVASLINNELKEPGNFIVNFNASDLSKWNIYLCIETGRKYFIP